MLKQLTIWHNRYVTLIVLVKNRRTVRDCTATKDTECECAPGFFCNDESCGHCHRVQYCPPGQGVKVKGMYVLQKAFFTCQDPQSGTWTCGVFFFSSATHTNNTICAACEDGTYSNVTDYLSPCKTHTRSDASPLLLVSFLKTRVDVMWSVRLNHSLVRHVHTAELVSQWTSLW